LRPTSLKGRGMRDVSAILATLNDYLQLHVRLFYHTGQLIARLCSSNR
jgi:hypothetical protein